MPLKIPAGCSKERVEEIRTWAYKIWDIHWRDYAPTSNSRADFLQYCVRDHKLLDEELMKKIELAVQAYTKHLHAKKKAGDRLIGVKTLSVWYNKSCYDDQFIDESAASLAERRADRHCSVEGCKNLVHGPAYDQCTDHIPNRYLPLLRDHYRKMVDGDVIDPESSLTPQCRKILNKHLPRVHKDLELES